MLEGGYAVWYLTYAVTCVGVYRRRTNVPSPASEDSGSGTVPGGQEGEGGTSGLDYPSFPEIKDLSDEGEGGGVTLVRVTWSPWKQNNRSTST